MDYRGFTGTLNIKKVHIREMVNNEGELPVTKMTKQFALE